MLAASSSLVAPCNKAVFRLQANQIFYFLYFLYSFFVSTHFCFCHRHHRDQQRRGGHIEGDQVLHPPDSGADCSSTQPGRGQQAHQLGGLPEGELRGHTGAVPHQPGEVSHGVVGPQHHLQPPQAGQRAAGEPMCFRCGVRELMSPSN